MHIQNKKIHNTGLLLTTVSTAVVATNRISFTSYETRIESVNPLHLGRHALTYEFLLLTGI